MICLKNLEILVEEKKKENNAVLSKDCSNNLVRLNTITVKSIKATNNDLSKTENPDKINIKNLPT